VLAGFDFPIGVPRAYADAAGISDFVPFLRALGSPPWDQFYSVARRPEEISVSRPFYPFRPGGTSQAHLTRALAVPSMRALLRRCEVGAGTRGDACALFWTLGPNQVGKAAISGWRDVLRPAMDGAPPIVRLWPFEGPLHELLRPGVCVIAETYPAEAGTHLGLDAPGATWSKRSQADRRRAMNVVLPRQRAAGVRWSQELEAVCADGFGEGPQGEDAFDAVIGLLAMIEVATGRRAEGVPAVYPERRIEGWILGQQATWWT
jgi:hypothetical protein